MTDSKVRKKQNASQLRIHLIATVAAALLLIVLSSPVLSDSRSCKFLQDAERVTLQTLFLYSQLVERPEDISQKEPTVCYKGGIQLTPPVPKMIPISISSVMPNARRLHGRMVDVHEIQRAFVEPSTQINNMLHVGCRHTIFNIDVAVEMRFFRRDNGADVVQLGVVRRPLGGDSSDWVPVIQPNGTVADPETDVILLPGTDSFRLFWANFWGEMCALPAARFTINAMCEYANNEEGEASGLSLRTENGKLTLVGHSLGGAAAQYIATSRPFREEPKCPGVRAYAFGSTGLTLQPSNTQSMTRGTLTSYISECDWLIQRGFASRIQLGRVFTLSRTDSHFIDGIQGDICDCLRDTGNHSFGEQKSSRGAPQNRMLCPNSR